MSVAPPTDKAQILKDFQALRQQQKQSPSPLATKEEEAEKANNQALLTQAATYTTDAIVNGTATLQLEFGASITALADRLGSEAAKLATIRTAIAVATTQRADLQNVRLVADALYLLRQGHQAQLTQLATQIQAQQDKVQAEQVQTRKEWQREAAEFEQQQQEQQARILAERSQAEADYTYELERDRQVALDAFNERQRQQERDIADQTAANGKDWAAREAILTANAPTFATQQAEIAGYEERLKTAEQEAKVEAIKEAERTAKVQSDLLEKEWTAEQQGYELQLTSLETTIARQNEQIADLMAQLQTINQQAQALATQAFS
ncbi:hypothetical protein [Spirulina major]|uniref:hypothetical protein n=1 Tax=Spirulina major TaxID=270636 RepID=UPI0009335740|nr:hypothetical protein [Spirulina major]